MGNCQSACGTNVKPVARPSRYTGVGPSASTRVPSPAFLRDFEMPGFMGEGDSRAVTAVESGDTAEERRQATTLQRSNRAPASAGEGAASGAAAGLVPRRELTAGIEFRGGGAPASAGEGAASGVAAGLVPSRDLIPDSNFLRKEPAFQNVGLEHITSEKAKRQLISSMIFINNPDQFDGAHLSLNQSWIIEGKSLGKHMLEAIQTVYPEYQIDYGGITYKMEDLPWDIALNVGRCIYEGRQEDARMLVQEYVNPPPSPPRADIRPPAPLCLDGIR